ncbi:sulfotransferase domain-containing protein [Vibrio pectenicida]|uniref:Sulfotransferase domain-containing protein n=1 Tax=Vibrio pectenicida TaxID=62763 RepID=A0A7Y3ZXG9_9VIBR|nr:sulfotransferase domain-containing protein [Vibrio pectenicida]NOH70733.1 sulfotransferase domain-containing protein [Vibrio pectenicida]
MKPNFIIGGTVAAGTSFLSSSIIQHPEIYIPKETRPEPSFFYKSWEYSKGMRYYEDKYFKNCTIDHIAIGERSSLYLHGGEKVAKRISENLPNIKLIFILKNPIDRAYSNYRFTALEGLEELSFEDAIKKEEERTNLLGGRWSEIKPFSNVDRGYYHCQLESYFKYFKKEQILILKSEDLAENPYDNFSKVFKFIGVDDTFLPELVQNFTSLNVKNLNIQREMREYFSDRYYLIVEALREEKDPIQYANTELDIEKINILKENMENSKIDMSLEAREMLSEKFKGSNEKLRRFIDFDIADWT